MCDNCGSHLTEQYARVFAANDGTLHACRNCSELKDMTLGAGAGVD